MKRFSSGLMMVLALLAWSGSGQAETLRLGVLKFGTVNWEMDTISHHGLDRAAGFELALRPLASGQALKVALQGEAVDVIVADWVWVARQRGSGQHYSFVPYSTTVGGLVVPQGSPIRSLSDLAGKKLGIGGGPLDKSWLLLQALSSRMGGIELREQVETVYGAPPLINQQLLENRVDAVINYWHYVARLEALGHHQFMSAERMMKVLGVNEDVPFLGFVFAEDWGREHAEAVQALFAASTRAKSMICEDEAEWKRLAPLVKAESGRVSNRLKRGYCDGVPKRWGEAERAAAGRVFEILRQFGGADLVGAADALDPATFWPDIRF